MPRFVVLEHRWRGVHWDLMLEVEPGGRLRTWALDDDPRTTPPPWSSRALPDHRAAYLTYEGPVSGDRGTVRRIESGTYETIAWTDRRVEVVLRPDGAPERRLVLTRSEEEAAGHWVVHRANVD